ncbi:MAG: rhomboid family intramembrane serine protease [Planctomycetes bacterium]|nr:rhomboid family intramembrane serine protease [Planctomycetota bacterium]NOG54471.1 rhomboid family intramembrane serine protease [Planctomycetota bacterium]
MIPLNTDRPLKTTSIVTPALIVVNLLVTLAFVVGGEPLEDVQHALMLQPLKPKLWQFVTYQFLHGGLMHLLGNMLFLWVFGQSVEDRLGRIAFLGFYLTGGILAGIAHVLTEPVSPVVGASGAIAAVTGAFLALFPHTKIRILWLFIIIGVFEIPSLWFIGFSFARDVFSQLRGGGEIAYSAHIAGNVFGCAVGLGLLFFRLLPREPYDLFTLVSHWYRRRRFRRIAERGYDPWAGVRRGKPSAWKKSRGKKEEAGSESSVGAEATPADRSDRPRTQVPVQDGSSQPGDDHSAEQSIPTRAEHDEAEALIPTPEQVAREALGELLEAGRYEAAADAYVQLMTDFPKAALGHKALLDVANTLFRTGQHQEAAAAYGRFLSSYPTEDPKGQVRLVYGLLLVRYVGRPADAQTPLIEAIGRLHQQSDLDLAEALLKESGYVKPAEGDAPG